MYDFSNALHHERLSRRRDVVSHGQWFTGDGRRVYELRMQRIPSHLQNLKVETPNRLVR